MTRDHARDAAIRDLYLGGQSLAQIGALYGLTRERIRQLLTRQGVPRRSKGRARIKSTG